MAGVRMELVKQLRAMSGAGMMDCKNALEEAEGDLQKAFTILREKGIAKAGQRAGRTTGQGVVESYLHNTGDGYPPQVGVLIEVNCETDFVARNERFKELVRDVAMHVAAMSPQFLDRESVPSDVLDGVKAELEKTVPSGKPPDVVEKILSGKLNKWYEEHALLEQPFVKDDAQSVGELVNAVSGVLGEKIRVRRYMKYALGEE